MIDYAATIISASAVVVVVVVEEEYEIKLVYLVLTYAQTHSNNQCIICVYIYKLSQLTLKHSIATFQ